MIVSIRKNILQRGRSQGQRISYIAVFCEPLEASYGDVAITITIFVPGALLRWRTPVLREHGGRYRAMIMLVNAVRCSSVLQVKRARYDVQVATILEQYTGMDPKRVLMNVGLTMASCKITEERSDQSRRLECILLEVFTPGLRRCRGRRAWALAVAVTVESESPAVSRSQMSSGLDGVAIRQRKELSR